MKKKDKMKKGRFNLHDKVGDKYYIDRRSKRYKKWKRKILERDKYTCRCCGKAHHRKGELTVHHLDSFMYYPKGRLDMDNAISLCYKCHKQFHGEFGMHRNFRNQTVGFVNKIREKLGLIITLKYKKSVLPI